MSRPPLRFLVVALGLWVCARAAILAPGWWAEADAPAPSVASAAVPAPVQASPPARPPTHAPSLNTLSSPFLIRSISDEKRLVSLPTSSPPLAISPVSPWPGAEADAGAALMAPEPVVAAPWLPSVERFAPPRAAGAPRRWSVSGWVLVRPDPGGAALAPGGTLGGSQAGARISYRLGGGLALSGRASLPLRRIAGAEAAAGLDWRPVAAIPVNLLAERRQALGGEGRSAFALTLHGGVSQALPLGLRLDAYAQAGVVGARKRNLFVDGAVRVAAPVGRLDIGVGARGAAQPGAARLDAGPGLAYRLRLRGATLRIEADWRFRVAGGAAPRSGPALTLATDF